MTVVSSPSLFVDITDTAYLATCSVFSTGITIILM